MKNSLLILITLLVSNIAFASNNCPNFSGKYVGTFRQPDSRYQETIEWVQNSCEEYTLNVVQTSINGSKPYSWKVTHDVTLTPRNNGSYWDNQEMVYLSLNASSGNEATGPCNIRDIDYKDSDKNLRFKWRFECTNYTSPWYVDNVGGLYIRVK